MNRVRCNGHGSELCQSAKTLHITSTTSSTTTPTDTHLPDNGAFKDNQHEQREQTVIPVLVQAPQRNTEHLEDEERRRRMLAKELRERRDRDVELVLAVKRVELLDVIRAEAFGVVVRGKRRMTGRRVREDGEDKRRRRLGDVGIALIAERVRQRVGRVLFRDGYDVADAAVCSGDETYAVRVLDRAGLQKIRSAHHHYPDTPHTHLASRDPCPCTRTPLCYQETQRMSDTQRDTREERPLLALEPVFIFDEVGVGEDGVEGEEREGVEVCVPGEGAV